MFVTLIPKSPDIRVMAGYLEDSATLVISIISPTPKTVWTTYSVAPEDFREDFCEHCYRYSENREYENNIDREDYFDEEEYLNALEQAEEEVERELYETEGEYEEAVEEARDLIDREDFYRDFEYEQDCELEYESWREDGCEGGIDLLWDDCCTEFNIKDVVSTGQVEHTTIPHVYQYKHFLDPNHRSSFMHPYMHPNPNRDYDCLFAIGEKYIEEEGDIKFKYAPYEVGNVFNDGRICWGDNELTTDVRDSYNLFWTSTFNQDLVPGEWSAESWLKQFHKHSADLNWGTASAKLFFGEWGISSDEPTELPIEGIVFIPSFNGEAVDLTCTLLTWLFKDEQGCYFAYNTLEPDKPKLYFEKQEQPSKFSLKFT